MSDRPVTLPYAEASTGRDGTHPEVTPAVLARWKRGAVWLLVSDVLSPLCIFVCFVFLAHGNAVWAMGMGLTFAATVATAIVARSALVPVTDRDVLDTRPRLHHELPAVLGLALINGSAWVHTSRVPGEAEFKGIAIAAVGFALLFAAVGRFDAENRAYATVASNLGRPELEASLSSLLGGKVVAEGLLHVIMTLMCGLIAIGGEATVCALMIGLLLVFPFWLGMWVASVIQHGRLLHALSAPG
ncbi:MAG: hypothetical protein AAF743_06270 [Planctomycetota bacterium]